MLPVLTCWKQPRDTCFSASPGGQICRGRQLIADGPLQAGAEVVEEEAEEYQHHLNDNALPHPRKCRACWDSISRPTVAASARGMAAKMWRRRS